MKFGVILAAVMAVLGGCAAMSSRTAGDSALCAGEATDQVERAAQREFCR